MAEELLETVDKLQSRLGENQDPGKLVRTLRRLGELPMTVEILVETGVGKAVNSLRKHDIVGELAKSLVAKWKKLVPQTTDRPSNSHHTKPQSHRAEERGHKRIREPSPEPSPEPSYDQDQEEDEDDEGYNQNYSPEYGSPQRNSYQSDEYDSPQPEPSPPPPPPPPRKEPKQSSKPSKEVHKNHHHSRDRAEERRPGSSDRREGKKREVERERHHSPELKPPKHKKSSQEPKREDKKSQSSNGRARAQKDSPVNEEEEEFEAPSMSFESFLTYDAPISAKKKKKPTPSSSSSSSHSRPSHSSSSSSSSSRPPAPQAPSSSKSSSSSSSSSKVKKSNGSSSSKRPHSSSKSSSSSGAPSEKRKKVVEVVPTLPDIPLPAIQPNYRPLPSIDVTPLSPQRRKVALCNDEEDAGFTGKRLNTKMTVFSGSKTSYLPRMMTLYEQCIRVLQNNIDSIAEVGGVPFEILEPVLERCTPEQLYRIEQSNQWFTEDSDELWMRHCKRDFKREQPQELETWRELYLRLHDEREERLRLLTQNITSAHANKPKGRQVKMAFVNSIVKPPRDVRRRQEKFGTSSGSSASSTAAAAPIKVRPVFTAESSDPSHASSSSSSSSSLSLTSSSSVSRPSLSSAGSSAAAAARDKPQVKKIAPMMAKTIKAFKNRFSRR